MFPKPRSLLGIKHHREPYKRDNIMRFITLLWLMLFPVLLHAAPGQFHYVGTLQTEVKEEPSAEAETKFIIAIGRKLVEFDAKGDWVWVGIDKSGGKDGWVHRSQLSPTDPDGVKY